MLLVKNIQFSSIYGPFVKLAWAPFREAQFLCTYALFQDFSEETGNDGLVARSYKIYLCNLFIICKFLKNSKLRKFIKFNA